jgi:hypothetical protein
MDIVHLNQIVSQDLAILQEQVDFHKKRAAKLDKVATADSKSRAKLHIATAEKLLTVYAHIQVLHTELINVPALKPITINDQLSLSLDEIQDLPPELLAELSVDADKTEFAILALLREGGGVLSMDKILIGLFKRTGEIHKRSALNNRLYRMEKNGDLFKVPGKKSAYSIRELTTEELEQLNPKALPKSDGEDLA